MRLVGCWRGGGSIQEVEEVEEAKEKKRESGRGSEYKGFGQDLPIECAMKT
jgi:hypothetical protein